MSNDNVTKLIQPGAFDDPLTEVLRNGARTLLAQAVEAEDEMRQLGASSKLNAEWEFFEFLHDLGRRTTENWLAENGTKLGVESTFRPSLNCKVEHR
ncbi:unnamed protein product, partial [marine sediment metagenome]